MSLKAFYIKKVIWPYIFIIIGFFTVIIAFVRISKIIDW